MLFGAMLYEYYGHVVSKTIVIFVLKQQGSSNFPEFTYHKLHKDWDFFSTGFKEFGKLDAA